MSYLSVKIGNLLLKLLFFLGFGFGVHILVFGKLLELFSQLFDLALSVLDNAVLALLLVYSRAAIAL